MTRTHTAVCLSLTGLVLLGTRAASADLSPPDWAEYHGARAHAEGLVALQHGRFADALVAARTAVELNGEHSHSLYLLGVALIFDEQYDEARDALQRVVHLDPELAEAWHDLGLVTFHLGDGDAAMGAFGELSRLRPDSWYGPYRQAQTAGMLQEDWPSCERLLTEAMVRGFPYVASLPIDPEWGPVAEQAAFLEMVDRLLSSQAGGP